MKMLPLFGVLVLLGSLGGGRTAERQQHGIAFEAWIRETFFQGYQPSSPTQKWDIPAARNAMHGGIPVNPKAIKYQASVDLGDALRQFRIRQPFWLVVGFWRMKDGQKWILNITAVRVEPAVWRRLWGRISERDLEKLDAFIKDRTLGVREVRRRARVFNAGPPYADAVMRLNPKIDRTGQRRLQCSLRFADFYRYLAPEADSRPQRKPMLWGKEFPNPLP